MLYTTLTNIRAAKPCAEGWKKLLTGLNLVGVYKEDAQDVFDRPLAFETILYHNGVDDMLWCLRAAPALGEVKDHRKFARGVAVWALEVVEKQLNHQDYELKAIIATAKTYMAYSEEGNASEYQWKMFQQAESTAGRLCASMLEDLMDESRAKTLLEAKAYEKASAVWNNLRRLKNDGFACDEGALSNIARFAVSEAVAGMLVMPSTARGDMVQMLRGTDA